MHIFITGGSRGIGQGMVKEFLKLGHEVSFTATSEESLERAKKDLKGKFLGLICDVRSISDIELAKDLAVEKFKCIDIWINNAGISQTQKELTKHDSLDIKKVMDVNVLGMIYGTKVALKEMKGQNFGVVYNMEGLGSDGMVIAKNIIYGSSKRLLRYFSRGMNKELKEFDNIFVGTLSPGMVFTDLLLKDSSEESIKIMRILGNTVEEVTPFLVKKMIKGKRRIFWLTKRKIAFKFIKSVFTKNKEVIK